jgi:hypothetical protein
MTRGLKLLTFTTLYPSSVRPRHGIFVETRLQQLLKHSDAEARVVAPVPWFPLKSERFGDYAAFARTPLFEVRSGIEVYHPRYAMVPAAGMFVQPFSLARAGMRQLRSLASKGYECDVVDAHYFYPDGVAAAPHPLGRSPSAGDYHRVARAEEQAHGAGRRRAAHCRAAQRRRSGSVPPDAAKGRA